MFDTTSVRSRMQEVVDLVATDVGAIRAGRANPNMVEKLEIDVYGGSQKLKINELATITAHDAQTIIINPWDKSIIEEINRGIMKSELGVNPFIDDEVIRINVPPLTTEDREKFIKLLSVKLENARVMIRQIRAEIRKRIKKQYEDKELNEDEKFRQEKKIQELTDKYIEKIDSIGDKKKQELTEL
jgi:ribosome recycling factor